MTAGERAAPRSAIGGADRLSGEDLLGGLQGALAWLQVNQDQTNELNVFPVPDGDTGSNMYLTLRSAVEEAQRSKDPGSAASVASAAAHGSLMGARGNSGVILSQILRGFSQGIENRRAMDAPTLARALVNASTVAYRAVMKPTEGTILTVIRDASTAAREAADGAGDLARVLRAGVAEGHRSVRRTIDQLAVLREAGVVDAGGYGLAVILEGLAAAVLGADHSVASEEGLAPGAPRVRAPLGSGAQASVEHRGAAGLAVRDEGYGFCTEFLISGSGLDVDALRTDLGSRGESVLIVGDAQLVRVHIHTTDPERVIAAASERGSLSKLKVEDMTAQHHEVRERGGAEEGAPVASPPPEAPGGARTVAVVGVAPAAGFRELLLNLGASRVVEGGQTMNPSIEDLLTAVRAADAPAVLILPNNGNVILTAEQVDALAEGIDVTVIPTRNLPQGISALLAFDGGAPAADNSRRMTAAMERVRAVEITRAVRDSQANGLAIRAGDVIAVIDDTITQTGDTPAEVIEAVLCNLDEPPDLVTVYRGAEVGEDEGEALVERLRGGHPTVEFELHGGGQAHYPYVLSLE